MWTYYPELAGRAVPRYTSYPTAAEFHDGVGASDMEDAINCVGADDRISLYLHIPYCKEICWYCGCNTGAANKTKRLSSYLSALECEVMLLSDRLGSRGKVTRIAFGGGSPNAISQVEFARLVDRVLTLLPCDKPDIAVEIDPRIFSDSWAGTLKSCGVSRVSLGVQSFSPEIQRAIGRIQPTEQILTCVTALRSHGIDAINFDLMYGLPGQTVTELGSTLQTAMEMKPSRIALFGYAHLPSMIPRQKRIDSSQLPTMESRFEMAALGYGLLTDAGYMAVGFDHFALADDPLAKALLKGAVRRNFQGFTEDDSEILIGLGASAISCFPDRLLQNAKNPGRYRMLISEGKFSVERGIRKSADDQIRARIIERLLCSGRSGAIPPDLLKSALPMLIPLAHKGLFSIDGEFFSLRECARPYARVVASAFDAYRTPKDSISAAV